MQGTGEDKQREGVLYIVSTPIGNLGDITLRALRILKEVDMIAAEDTRQTKKLLNHYEIKKHPVSYHDHNKIRQGEMIAGKLKEGLDVALVSDAGTPGISDPSYYLINLSLKEGIRVEPVPGPTAAITALSISGLPTDRFVFEGFLPRKKGKRRKRLEELSQEERTIILYESPYRIYNVLEEIFSVMGNRKIVIGREMTKRYEEIIRGELEYILGQMKGREIKGEITVILKGPRE
jgi:16S rRNA (cytidine1402-2'-O)-methyltransferase